MLILVSLYDFIYRKICGFCEVFGKIEISLWSFIIIKVEFEVGRFGDS